MASLDEGKAELRKATEDLARTHNILAEKLIGIQEQLNSHELKLGGQTAKKGSTPWANQAASMWSNSSPSTP